MDSTEFILTEFVFVHFQVPVEIQNRQLVGCIEDVSFDDAPVGLWNFILSGNSYRGCHR